MLKQYTLCLLFCWVASLATAQLNLGLQLNFQPDPDPRQWADQDGLLIVTAVNPTGQSYDFRYRGRMLLDGKVIMDNSLNKMPVENIGAFETTISEVQDVLPPLALNLYGEIEKTYLRTNQIPAGFYLICAQIVTPDGSQALSAEACVPLTITNYQQPSLVFPAADMPMPMNSLPTFAWTPVTPPPPFPVNYRLRAVEVADVFGASEENNSTKYPMADATGWSAVGEISGVWGIANENEEPSPVHAQATGSATNPTANRAQATGSATNPTANRAQATGSATNPTANRSASSTNLMQAFQYGFPLLDLELPGQTQAIWPPDVQEPQPGRQYVWSVQALRADDDSPVGANNGMAEPRAFTIASPPDEEEADFPIPLAIVQMSGCYLNVYADGTWHPGGCPTTPPAGGNGPLEIRADKGVFATGSQQPLFRTPVDLEQEWAMEAETPPTTQRTTDGSIEVLPGSKFTIANKTSGNSQLRTGQGGNVEVLPGSKFTLANKSGGSNSLRTANPNQGDSGDSPAGMSKFTLANKSGGSNSLRTANPNQGDSGDPTPGLEGEPIPGIDIILEQIPGGIAPPSPGTENVVAVVQYGGQTFALLNDGTWDNLLPAADAQGRHGHHDNYSATCPQCNPNNTDRKQAPGANADKGTREQGNKAPEDYGIKENGVKATSTNEPPITLNDNGKNSGRSNSSGCCANYVVIAAPKSPTDPLARKAPLTVEKPFGEAPDAETMDITIFDANRQEVSGWTMQSYPQDNELSIDLSKLPAGQYTVRMVAGEKVKEVKVGEAPSPEAVKATQALLENELKQGVVELNKKKQAEYGFSITANWQQSQSGGMSKKFNSVAGKVSMKDVTFEPGSYIFLAKKGVILTMAPLYPDGSYNLSLLNVGDKDAQINPVYVYRPPLKDPFCYDNLPSL